MNFEYISSDEEEIYMKTDVDEEEINDISDLRSELERFQQEDIVKEALKNDVDLSIYGEQIEQELKEYSNISIKDYINESKNIAHLHLEIGECSTILHEMENIILKYQHDLDRAVNEIQLLQSESDRISMRVKNRKEIDSSLHDLVKQLILSPNMVNVLISGELNEEYIGYLNEFSTHLDYVECIDVDDNEMLRRSAIKAIEEIKLDMNILSLHCGNRIRDTIFRKFSEIRKDSNIEIFQKEVLLKLKDGVLFLQRHLKTYYDEILQRYGDIMKGIIYQTFNEYYVALKKQFVEIAPEEEFIVMSTTKHSILKKKTQFNSSSIFVLGDRHSIIDFASSAPLLPSILVSDNRMITFPELFRSIQRHLIECALGEFQFEVLFFNPEDTSLFIDVFNAACEVIHQAAVQWIRNTYDVVGIMLLCILLQSGVEELAKEGTPILQEFFSNIKSKAIFRMKELLNSQIKNVKSVPVQPKNLNITSEVHSSIKRYADLSCGIYVLGLSYDMFMDKQVWIDSMNTLALEMVNLLMKLASCVKENKRPSYILNSCLFVAEVYELRHLPVDNDFMRLYHDRLHLYIEEMMAKHFSSVVGIVDKYAERQSVSSFTTIEGKNIQKYATGWKESIRIVNERIQQDFQYRAISVYKMFASEVTTYHSKFVQLLQGTPYAKDVVPVQTVVNELVKYRGEYEKIPPSAYSNTSDE